VPAVPDTEVVEGMQGSSSEGEPVEATEERGGQAPNAPQN
jgi:hypothetical protein